MLKSEEIKALKMSIEKCLNDYVEKRLFSWSKYNRFLRR